MPPPSPHRPPPGTGSAAAASSEPQLTDPRALPALYRLASLTARTDDPAIALRELLDLAVTTFGAHAGSVALLNPDSGRLEIEVQSGSSADGALPQQVQPGHGITGWCALNRRSLLVPDVGLEPRYIVVRPSARCEMTAPILTEDNVVGVIDLECDRVGGFSPADLNLLERLAAEAALVLPRLWQVGHLRNKARQLESLVTAGQLLVTKLAQQDLFETLTREARTMMQAQACGLYLFDAARGTVRCAAFSSERGVAPPAGDLPFGSCLVGSPIQTRRQVWFADIRSPEFRELLDLPADPALRTVLANPMLSEGDVLGVIVIFSDRMRRFDNDEKRLCAALASLTSVVLQNARLYARVFQSEDVLRKNERLTTLGLLAAEIAHEIRNPLTVLKLLHGGLGADFPAGDPRHTDMRVIREKLDQLESIVTRVLGFAKAPSSLHSRWSFAEIIADTLVLVRLKLAQSKVTVHFTPPDRPLFVEAHKGQIQQVVLNLLINASQAMPAGGTITLNLTTEDRSGGVMAILDLKDTGTGVPEALRDRIFDSFLSGRPDGTGLGLAIAKRILLGHHGDIVLSESSPAGTTMRVTVPVAR